MNPVSPISRRRALQLLAGTALLGAGSPAFPSRNFAAATASGLPPSPQGIPAGKIRPLLRPSRIGNVSKPVPYCIDVHAHLFNASDIDVVGFMKKDVGHAYQNPFVRRLIEGLADVAGILRDDFAVTAAREHQLLVEWLEKLQGVSDENVRKFLDDMANGHRRNIASAIARQMKSRDLDKLYLMLQGIFIEQMRTTYKEEAAPLNPPTVFDEKTVLNAIDPERRINEYERQFHGLPGVVNAFNPAGMLEFTGHMLSYRWMNLRDYTRAYTENAAAFGIDAMFASFVNFDYWLAPATKSPQAEQMKLHAFLSKLSGGYMLPIVAYNPWTDINDRDASFELVKDAVMNFGFVGVKIYPPTGFYPYGNSSLPYASSEPHPDLVELDAKMFRLASWCASNNVPLMAHSAESNGRDNASDVFGGPVGWNALLKKMGAKTPVIATLAHFGGGESDATDPSNNWPRDFAQMMATPQGRRLYGDLAYWDQIMNCQNSNESCTVAKQRIKAAFSKNPDVAKRLMFGTDWDMLSRESRWETYPVDVLKNLGSFFPSINDLLYTNALSCFGLGVGGAQRNRVIAQLGQVDGPLPGWLLPGNRAP